MKRVLMSDSSCDLCGVELEESYGVILSLALIDRQGQHQIIPDEDPTQVMCEKCWEGKEEEMSKLFKVL
jgi:hypothetical protein|tara:strand:- start:439 stop:645 length:207 start_codon:yes stop_codon:yes gene_type:complete